MIIVVLFILSHQAPFGLIDLLPFIKPRRNFSVNPISKIDYSNQTSWFINQMPLCDDAVEFNVDIFYLHRTTYLQKTSWNATIRNKLLNFITWRYAVKSQASIFNGLGRVFAPKYRQATLYSFYDDSGNGQQALDLAYSDIKDAFEYYLTHHQNGRDIILVGHSQGTALLIRLIKEYFDNNVPLLKNLVCAYLVGMPVPINAFANIPPSNEATDFSCFISWSTFGDGGCPRYFKSEYLNSFCVSPLTWKSENVTNTDKYQGGKTYYLNLKRVSNLKAYVNNGFLNISYPGFGYPFLKVKDYVLVDFHLFFFNIRMNVKERIINFYKNKP